MFWNASLPFLSGELCGDHFFLDLVGSPNEIWSLLGDVQSLWTLSVLDDIATHALRLKFVAFLPEVPENMRAQILRLISAEGRFSLITANAMLKVRL